MIDEFSMLGDGWARFSDDRTKRYRLARSLNGRELNVTRFGLVCGAYRRVVFLMLNPSTADAFKLDPTVRRCASFAREWGADVLEVVNLFALRATDPAELYVDDHRDLGADDEADDEILGAVIGAWRVVAAWGFHGSLNGRDRSVRNMLRLEGVELHHLGLTKTSAQPRHPLYLPATTRAEAWQP